MLGKNSKLAAEIKKLNTSAAYRRETGLFVCEGKKMLEEAEKSGVEICNVIIKEGEELPDINNKVQIDTASEALIKSLSQVNTPQGIIFICRKKQNNDKDIKGRIVILDRLQDPGNVGTVLRTAEAFETDMIILTPDSADPYSPKVVRSSMGAVFRQRFEIMERDAIISLLKQNAVPLYAAAGGGSVQINTKEKNIAVVIGNEGAGVSKKFFDAADGIVSIPMGGKCESLNAAVAASILMWEMFR